MEDRVNQTSIHNHLRPDSSVQLDGLLKSRFHGAVNIRGIRYQILYSLHLAMEFYSGSHSTWRIDLEGIEDVDLKGIRTDTCYIQVKTSEHSWNWAKLKKPIGSFLEVSRKDPDGIFHLAVDFHLRNDVEKLARITTLRGKELERIKKKFRSLCNGIGATAEEADCLLSKLQISSKCEQEVWHATRQCVTEAFGLGSETVDVYIQVLISHFLDWANQRQTVECADIDQVREEVSEALSRESSYQAFGLGLLDRLHWTDDPVAPDYFAGKRTRPGHIVAGLDVVRPTWLEKLGETLDRFGVCVVRAPSGQGKSTLAYRYAHDRWPSTNTFVLRVARTPEQVQLITDYLRFRASLFPALKLLIDNAGWQTSLWPEVVREVVALGGQVLVTIRNEDWHRFARESSTSYGLVEPFLDIDEARMVFQVFRDRERIYHSVISAEWAYERVGKPHLLMEFVYLITHGQMLEEKLRDQIKDFSDIGEDPAKMEILRRVALASAFDAPLDANKLLASLALRDDVQQVLQPLVGEYIETHNGYIYGLHWVRCDHLLRILHDCFRNLTTTAINALPAVPQESLPAFISNAISSPDIKTKELLTVLADKSRDAGVEHALSCLDGIFAGGERLLFNSNRVLFEEAYSYLGPAGTFLLSTSFMPFAKTDIIGEMVGIFEDKDTGFTVLKEIADKAQSADRGLDLCREFLSSIGPNIEPDTLALSRSATGKLLDWCAITHVELSHWEEAKSRILPSDLHQMSIEEFCAFCQGIHRYDRSSYTEWFGNNREEILGYLKLQLDCIDIYVDSDVTIRFLLDPNTEIQPHDQTMSRLTTLRMAVPFCLHYRSQGIWALPFGLDPYIDETEKNIPQESFPLPSDVEKNVVWRTIVETEFLSDTHYRYQQHWYQLRSKAIAFAAAFTKWLKRGFSGKQASDDNAIALANDILELVRVLPDPPPQTPSQITQVLKTDAGGWATHLQNFLRQLDSGSETIRLAVHNFREAVKFMPRMQAAISDLLVICPDYFGMADLRRLEESCYAPLEAIIDVIQAPPLIPQRDLPRYIAAQRDSRNRVVIEQIARALQPLGELGVDFQLAKQVYLDHPLRYYTLMFSVLDSAYPELTLPLVCLALADISEPMEDYVDFFFLIPICCGARIWDGGYRLAPDKIQVISQGQEPNWESFAPIEVSEPILALLPEYPVRPPDDFQLRYKLQAVYTCLSFLGELEKWLFPLGVSKSPYDIELLEKWSSKLNYQRNELMQVVNELKEFTETRFVHASDRPEYQNLIQMALDLNDGLRYGECAATLLSSSSLGFERIADIVIALRA